MIKAVIFDLWLTLGTKNVGISSSLREKFNIEKTNDFMHLYEKAVQLKKWSSEEEMARNFLEVFSLDDQPGDVEWIINLFREGVEKATMYPGMKELLLELKKNYKLGFISNTTIFESVVLDKWGIREIFDVISFSWEIGSKKPTREIFDVTLEKLGVQPEEAIFIDDGQKNIDAAVSYGLKGILFENTAKLKGDLKHLFEQRETLNLEVLKQKLLEEGFPIVYEWFDEAGTIYKEHEHQDKVSFYIVKGGLAITFENKEVHLKKGDRFDVPPKTKHYATVGGEGCRYVVGQMTEEDA